MQSQKELQQGRSHLVFDYNTYEICKKTGVIDFINISSSQNTADIFTKALPLAAHRRHFTGLDLVTRSD